jgi:hypothetical protein
MDVQATAVPAPPPVAPAAGAPAPAPAATPPEPPVSDGSAPAPVSGGSTAGSGTSATGTVTPGKPPGSNGPASNQPQDATLSPVVAKLFNSAAQNVEVSFQVLHNPDEVVTVFTDRATGKEIIQFPSQALVALAEMVDKKDAGSVLDKSV